MIVFLMDIVITLPIKVKPELPSRQTTIHLLEQENGGHTDQLLTLSAEGT